MRPQYRSTRSARAIPPRSSVVQHKYDSGQSQATRSTSLADTIPLDSESAPRSDAVCKKQIRQKLTHDQISSLEARYAIDTHPTTAEKQVLGRAIGLEVKTVAVWFQNRRQAEKKAGRSAPSSSSSGRSGLEKVSGPSSNTTLSKRARPRQDSDGHQAIRDPLVSQATTLDYADNSSGEGNPQEIENAPTGTNALAYQIQTFKANGGPGDTIISPHELWQPPALSEGSERESLSDAHDSSISVCAGPQQRGQHKRSLEWACNLQRKRIKNNRGEASPAGQKGADLRRAISRMILPGSKGLTAGPPEDVVRAATLLLCYKYSIQEPQQAEQI